MANSSESHATKCDLEEASAEFKMVKRVRTRKHRTRIRFFFVLFVYANIVCLFSGAFALRWKDSGETLFINLDMTYKTQCKKYNSSEADEQEKTPYDLNYGTKTKL